MAEVKRKTPAERAQEDLDVATRLLEKAAKRAEDTAGRHERAKATYEKVVAENEAAQENLAAQKKRVEFLSSHPDLPGNDGSLSPAEEQDIADDGDAPEPAESPAETVERLKAEAAAKDDSVL